MHDDPRFGCMRGGRRIWAVASIHGEAERLGRLHRTLAARLNAGDGLVYLGNMVGRGPAVADTITEILLFRRAFLARPGTDVADIVFLRGAQEEMWPKLLSVHFAADPRGVLEWMRARGVEATLAAYGASIEQGLRAAAEGARALARWTGALRSAMRFRDGHTALMSALRRAAFTDDGALLFVNAGIDAGLPLADQTDSFWWGATPFTAISGPVDGFGRIVRGYDRAMPGIQVDGHTATIDGGCGRGGPLLAVCFDAAAQVVDSLEA